MIDNIYTAHKNDWQYLYCSQEWLTIFILLTRMIDKNWTVYMYETSAHAA